MAKQEAAMKNTTVGDILRGNFPVTADVLDRIKKWLKIKGHSMRRALAIASFLAALTEETQVVIDRVLHLFGWSGNGMWVWYARSKNQRTLDEFVPPISFIKAVAPLGDQFPDFHMFAWPHDKDIKAADKQKKFRIPRGQSEARAMPNMSGETHVVSMKRSFNPNLPVPRAPEFQDKDFADIREGGLLRSLLTATENEVQEGNETFIDYSGDEGDGEGCPNVPTMEGNHFPIRQVKDPEALNGENEVFDMKNIQDSVVRDAYMAKLDEYQEITECVRLLDTRLLLPDAPEGDTVSNFYGRSDAFPDGDLVLQRRNEVLTLARALLPVDLVKWRGTDLPSVEVLNIRLGKTKADRASSSADIPSPNQAKSLAEVGWPQLTRLFPAASMIEFKQDGELKWVTPFSHLWWTGTKVTELAFHLSTLQSQVWERSQQLFEEIERRRALQINFAKPPPPSYATADLKGLESTTAFSQYMMHPGAYQQGLKSLAVANQQARAQIVKNAVEANKERLRLAKLAKKALAATHRVNLEVRKPTPVPKKRFRKMMYDFVDMIPFGYKGHGAPAKKVYEGAGWAKDKDGRLQPPAAQVTPLDPPLRISMKDAARALLRGEQVDWTKLAFPASVAEDHAGLIRQFEATRDKCSPLTDPWQIGIAFRQKKNAVASVMGWDSIAYAQKNKALYAGFSTGDKDLKHSHGNGLVVHDSSCAACVYEVFQQTVVLLSDLAESLAYVDDGSEPEEGTKSAGLASVSPMDVPRPEGAVISPSDFLPDLSEGVGFGGPPPATLKSGDAGEKPWPGTPEFGTRCSSQISFASGYQPTPTAKLEDFLQGGGNLQDIRNSEDSEEVESVAEVRSADVASVQQIQDTRTETQLFDELFRDSDGEDGTAVDMSEL